MCKYVDKKAVKIRGARAYVRYAAGPTSRRSIEKKDSIFTSCLIFNV